MWTVVRTLLLLLWVPLRWMLGYSPLPPPPPTRLTADQVSAIVAPIFASAQLPWGFMPPQVHVVDGRVVWSVSSPTVGSGWRVEVDDATGTAGPLTRWGVR